MKKTLITLLALTGVAMGESLDYNDLTEAQKADLYTVWDFDQTAGVGAAKVGGSVGGYTNTPIITYDEGNTTDGYGAFGATSGTVHKGSLDWSNYTISFDINTVTAGCLLSVKDSAGKYMYLSQSETSPITLTYEGVNGSIETALSISNIQDWSTITIVRNSADLTLYVDGESQGTLTISDSVTVSALQLGNKYGGATSEMPTSSGTIDNLTIWGKALSETEVKGLISRTSTPYAVPEPATATLSLLALAGLAARRRRK